MVPPKRSQDVLISDSDLTFDKLLTDKRILDGMRDAGYEKPSPIQLQSIPVGRLGMDLIAKAKSGTGKTVVFSVLALEKLDTDAFVPQARGANSESTSCVLTTVIIAAPTRELAVQITQVLNNISRHFTGIQIQTFIGGMALEDDKTNARKAQIVHLIECMALDVSQVKMVVLDEADKLMESHFSEQIKYGTILYQIPASVQKLFFSATYDESLLEKVESFTKPGAKYVMLEDRESPWLRGKYRAPQWVDDADQKPKAILDVLLHHGFSQCMVFTTNRSTALDLVDELNEAGLPAMHIHVQAAGTGLQRPGIDIEKVDLVISADVPRDLATYLHRVGRTGRFGTEGVAVIVVEKAEMEAIENLKNKHSMPLEPIQNLTGMQGVLDSNDTKRGAIAAEASARNKASSPAASIAFSNDEQGSDVPTDHGGSAMGFKKSGNTGANRAA
ncbi:hypothetical protein EV182_000142 [Spiromyces aspiralis]|uniref:Uncharacterized protein n=1 Tax=Spiromyces aspiralis TaxID=68401 RepID=A0ACC1HUT5_9FUNG|nr:hypothetical protein EV182_000142 [Spiromyces aspiralis]